MVPWLHNLRFGGLIGALDIDFEFLVKLGLVPWILTLSFWLNLDWIGLC